MRELSILRRKHGNIAKLVDMIAKVSYQMYLNKVEMGFGIDQVHTLVVLFFQILLRYSAPLASRFRDSLVHQRSSVAQLQA